MASNEELDNFRQKWREEVKLKKASNNADHTDTKQSPSQENFHPAFRETHTTTASTSVSLHRSDDNRQKTLDYSGDSGSNTMTYYPFNIVGNLLKSSSVPSEEKGKADIVMDNVQNRTPVSKRKASDSDRKKQKEKRAKLKDIFSLRENHMKGPNERILDCFIADLDEINTIPFFDLSIPREIAVNIFKHLDLKDLGRCSQVSKSWKSLAEDELLWCNICHRLGYDEDISTVEQENWKERVRQRVERKRMLCLNWKERKGKVETLQHDHKGVLCSVSSIDGVIIAGYTTGDVKMWDLDKGEECVFQPSMTSLMVNLREEWGTTANIVEEVQVSPTTIAATYTHGNLDLWRPNEDSGVSVMQTFSHSRHRYQDVCLSQSSPMATVAMAAGPFLEIYCMNEKQFYEKQVLLDATQHIKGLDLIEQTYESPIAVVCTSTTVKLHKVKQEYPPLVCDTVASCDDLLDIHNMVDYNVFCMDTRNSPAQIIVGLYDKIKLYDVESNREAGTFYGHTHAVTCISLQNSPVGRFVTGSQDRRVRVHDTRMEQPAITFSGSASFITTVQMDEWKVVSGNQGGFVCVWDQRMTTKLWEMHNRHPVGHCKFYGHRLVVGNIPVEKAPVVDEFETSYYRRQRGTVHLYDFSTSQLTEGVPEICLSSYDEPLASGYNISLAVPYDKL